MVAAALVGMEKKQRSPHKHPIKSSMAKYIVVHYTKGGSDGITGHTKARKTMSVIKACQKNIKMPPIHVKFEA